MYEQRCSDEKKKKPGKKNSSSWLSACTSDLHAHHHFNRLTHIKDRCVVDEKKKPGTGISRVHHGFTQVQRN